MTVDPQTIAAALVAKLGGSVRLTAREIVHAQPFGLETEEIRDVTGEILAIVVAVPHDPNARTYDPDAPLALRAVLSRKGPISISPDDLDDAHDLEIVVSDAPFGDPPGSKILDVRPIRDPRLPALEAKLAGAGILKIEAVRLAGEILEEVDRCEQ